MIDSAQFQKLEEDVYTYWPTAAFMPEDRDTISVFDHFQRYVRTNPVKRTDDRRLEFREFLRKKLEPLLGVEVAESVFNQLKTNHSFSTAQHYTTLAPKTLNPTLQTSLAYFDRTEPDRENIIVLGCAGISFNNHWFPRGHYFHSLINNRLVANYITFFGRASDADPVIFTKPYGKETAKAMEKMLLHLRSEKSVNKREFNRIRQFMDETLFTPHVLSQKYYVDQVTITNFYLWKQIFSTYAGHVPNLIFVSQEKIAADLLRTFHMKQKTVLYNVLFNTRWHDLIYKYFDNIMCAFSVERKYGTFLFWSMQKGGTQRVQLFAKDGVLESADGAYRYEMTPEVISSAIERDELLPSTMLTFLVLSMYYGFNLTGGLDQPTYLTQTKKAYLQLLTELGETEEVENVMPVVTEDIVLTRASLTFIGGPTGQREPATGVDLLLYGNHDSWPHIIEASKTVTMKELLYRLYPELYRDYCKHEGKDDALLSITEREIERFTGIDMKIPPWALFQPNNQISPLANGL